MQEDVTEVQLVPGECQILEEYRMGLEDDRLKEFWQEEYKLEEQLVVGGTREEDDRQEEQ